ncbi:hypothetical protein H257_18318 [Aphanomyces astaci]|uniref:Uncharacterized protein n=1 Tax=Aphanomyces astaci TaxID=112090 RepID=W4FBM1_APHAT|nr:hypothetical protein H257_13607 [Aphanomyces astaci]XP_009845656.1 hypothetical protein H257_18318 [Aphanomyces astaci]ETV64890.1 hypothetical protein H257_18318 [Aphanomyces astaci]ETV71233.1 hypothetical protein H257_13607 [Aphanomyces astaci]|eukprot:XP_009839479.1 hypothetical protein H257_13607 [Aphanomyces astaci]
MVLPIAGWDLKVADMITILRWANVSANRGVSKTDLQQRMTTQLFDGGPPDMTRLNVADFPSIVPESWAIWLQQHLAWQASTLPTSTLPPWNAPQPVPLGPPIAASENAMPTFWVFERKAVRTKPHTALGTVQKICSASDISGPFLDDYPLTKAAAWEFASQPCAKVMLWAMWDNLKHSVPDTMMLLEWYRPGDKAYNLARTLADECKEKGIHPSLVNLHART